MSKVKIQGHASGTGVLTVTAPNTSTDRTITLPDSTATIATTTDVAARLPSITDNGNATAITINDRENVGIGVSPKSWNNNMEALQLSSAAAFVGSTGGNGETARMLQNFYNSGAAELYIQDGYACQYNQSSDNGKHTFFTAPSGSADGTVTWTNLLEITNDGRGLSQFTAKAWANFDGSGTPSFSDSHNFSTITDNGSGDWKLNFTNNMANSNYSAATANSVRSGAARNIVAGVGSYATSGVTVLVETSDGDSADQSGISVIVFGD